MKTLKEFIVNEGKVKISKAGDLSFGDQIDANRKSREGKGVKIDAEIYTWIAKKFKTGSITNKDAAIKKQKVEHHANVGKSNIIRTTTITPLGDYLMFKSTTGKLSEKPKTVYYKVSR